MNVASGKKFISDLEAQVKQLEAKSTDHIKAQAQLHM